MSEAEADHIEMCGSAIVDGREVPGCWVDRSDPDLDPRWQWAEVRRLCDVEPTYIKGPCNHLEVVPVEAGGEVVAHLCLSCDAQLP